MPEQKHLSPLPCSLTWRLTRKASTEIRASPASPPVAFSSLLPRVRLSVVSECSSSKRLGARDQTHHVLPRPEGAAVLNAFALYNIDHSRDRHLGADLTVDGPRQLDVGHVPETE